MSETATKSKETDTTTEQADERKALGDTAMTAFNEDEIAAMVSNLTRHGAQDALAGLGRRESEI
jgi:hypothetical protein